MKAEEEDDDGNNNNHAGNSRLPFSAFPKYRYLSVDGALDREGLCLSSPDFGHPR